MLSESTIVGASVVLAVLFFHRTATKWSGLLIVFRGSIIARPSTG